MTSQVEPDVFYTTASQIKDALKVQGSDIMLEKLTLLHAQLKEATKVRIDPIETFTKPLVEHVMNRGDCRDIIDIWGYQHSNNIESLESIVPEVAAFFIKLCEAPLIRKIGLQFIRTILQQHMKRIYHGISSKRVFQSISNFRLLVAMASFDSVTTREVFEEMNFQAEGFLRAAKFRQNKKSNNPRQYLFDLRTYYVQFVLAFFEFGDTELKKQLLTMSPVVYGVFSGIEKDAYQLIDHILTVMDRHVFSDLAIPRGVKVKFFTSQVLQQIAGIYSRRDEERVDEENMAIPANVAHHFLLSICTVPGMGVCFHDAGWYPDRFHADSQSQTDKTDLTGLDKLQNWTLGRFLLGIRPADDLRQQELLFKILDACPSLVHWYWTNTSLLYEPRLSSKWLANATVLQKSIQLNVPSFYYGDTQQYPAIPPDAEVILENILPKIYGRTVSSKGLQHTSPLVRYTTMVILAAVFQKYRLVVEKMNEVIESFQGTQSTMPSQEDGLPNNILLAAESWKSCLVKIREGLRRRAPEIQTVVTLHNILTASKNNEMSVTDEETQAQHKILQDLAFRLIRYYQEFLPEALLEANLDPSKFIPSDILSIRSCSLVHLLELLLSLPDFQYTQKTAGSSTSHLVTLFTLYLRSSSDYVRQLTATVVRRSLKDSVMFNHDPEEIDLWLNSLSGTASSSSLELSSDQETMLRFLDDCMTRFGKTQYRYIDELVSLVQSVDSQLQSSDIGTKNSSFLGQLIGSDGEFSYPFSPLLLAVVGRLTFAKENRRPIIQFVSRLVTALQKKQKIPHYLKQFVEQLAGEIQVEPSMPAQHARMLDRWHEQALIAQATVCLSMLPHQDSPTEMELASTEPLNTERQLNDLLRQGQVDVASLQSGMTDLLDTLSVQIMASQFSSVADFCVNKLGWISSSPLSTYLCQRHPLAGSLFEYSHVQQALRQSTVSNPIITVLESIPLDMLFHNAWHFNESTLTIDLLRSVFDKQSYQEKCRGLALVLEYLSMLLLNDMFEKKHLFHLCLALIQCGLSSRDKDEKSKKRVLLPVTEHVALVTLRTQLLDTLYRLGEKHLNGPVSARHILIIDLAVNYLDVFGQGSAVYPLLNALVYLDFGMLRRRLEPHGQTNTVDQLFRLLEGCVCDKCHRQQRGQDLEATIPKEALVLIADRWKATNKPLDANMTLILSSVPVCNAAILLDACYDQLVRQTLVGTAYGIDMSILGKACQHNTFNVTSLVLEHLDHLAMTPEALYIAFLGYDMGSDPDDMNRIFEHIISHLITMTNETEASMSQKVYCQLAEAVDKPSFSCTNLNKGMVRDVILALIVDHLGVVAIVQFINALVKQLYRESDNLEPIETFIRHILDHERFSSLCSSRLDSPQTSSVGRDQRIAVVTLLYTLNAIQPMVFASHQHLLDDILACYGTTTSVADRLLLDILQSCEQHGKTTILPKMLFWGPDSKVAREAHTEMGTMSQLSTMSTATLGLVQPGMMKYTFTHFPFHASLAGCTEGPTGVKYDIAFYLPLLANLISSGQVDCSQLLECNAIGLIAVAMSSLDSTVRQLAYQMMDQFYTMVTYSTIRGRPKVLFVLDALKNAIQDRYASDIPPRLPAPTTVCIAHAISIVQIADHFMKPFISRWLGSNWHVDFNYVPMVSHVFSSTPEISSPSEVRKPRLWILRMLSSSIGSIQDYDVFCKQFVWDMIAVYYNSAFADRASKRAIVEILKEATKVPEITYALVGDNGLLLWIRQVLALCSDPEEKQTWAALESTVVKQCHDIMREKASALQLA